ncbi:hypothetical protein J2X72_004203 [Phyllobacterium sp. 1468]|nr:hypothetical protein [Phyllobacterium sp. 1468]
MREDAEYPLAGGESDFSIFGLGQVLAIAREGIVLVYCKSPHLDLP